MHSFFKPQKFYSRLPLLALTLLAGCAADLHHHDGMVAMERHEYVSAVDHLSQATEMRPSDLEYRKDWLRAREMATAKLLAVAAAAAAKQDNDEAEHNYREVLKYDRDNARALAGLEAL